MSISYPGGKNQSGIRFPASEAACSATYGRIADHASCSLPSDQEALAGLVDGSAIGEIRTPGYRYLRYSCSALDPFTATARIRAAAKIPERSFGTAFRIDASEDPLISQEAITS